MKKVLKFGTGQKIPEGAVYLCTKVQLKIENSIITDGTEDEWLPCWLVWHYFLVEISK